MAREYLSAERRESRADVTVQIEDVNDNAPVFEQDEYEAELPENPPVNTLVTTVTVSLQTLWMGLSGWEVALWSQQVET